MKIGPTTYFPVPVVFFSLMVAVTTAVPKEQALHDNEWDKSCVGKKDGMKCGPGNKGGCETILKVIRACDFDWDEWCKDKKAGTICGSEGDGTCTGDGEPDCFD